MDDDDDDDGSGMSHHGGSVEPQMLPPQFQNQAAFQHIRHQTPMNSPPIPNNGFHPQQRQHTPQPSSRPSSRNDNIPMNGQRRQSSNLVPQQHPHPQPANGYAYMPNPAIYNPNQPGMPPHPHGLPPHMQGQPMQGPPQGIPQPQYPNYGPPQQQQQPQHPHPQQIAQMYAEEQRRASMPPAFPQQERPPSRPESSPPQPQQQQIVQPKQEPDLPPPQQQMPQQQQLLEPVKRMSVKSRSIFTPIDEGRSILSQHWAMNSSSTAENTRADTVTSNNRSLSVDTGSISRPMQQSDSPPPPPRAQTHKLRNISTSSVPEGFHPPSRTNSASVGGKRPVLKVQIPDEPSEDGGSATADSTSSPNTTNQRRTGNSNDQSSGSGVVLPPPSPSTSTLLSAGASGPPNPFARPHHPVSQQSQNSNASNLIDTPVSALPSRFMNNEFLPSPSSFYPEWNFGGRESNTLPSPLNFATPVIGTGPSFLREDSGERMGGKRKTPDQDGGGSGEEGGGKRMKQGSP